MIPTALLLAASLAVSADSGETSRPNILFILSDDQRADTIGALGNPRIQTPHLDRLVRRGVVFHRAYCMGSQQGAVCVPSRAMLLSGRTLFHIKENLDDTTTWPRQFAAAGYDTFITGKWHNGRPSLMREFSRGNSVFLGGMTDPRKANVIDFNRDRDADKPHPVSKHCVEQFADEAVTFLSERKGDRPWLCYVAMNAPHDPCIVPDEFAIRYSAEDMQPPANYLPEHPFDNGELKIRDEMLIKGVRTRDAVKRELADYYRAVSYMDLQLGRILAALEKTGQAERTVIVFTSDHGLAKGSHGLLGKQNLYEHSMRTPLIIGGPGISPGTSTDAMCYLLDLFPTLGELASVPAPRGSEGRSLAGVLRGETQHARPHVLTAYRGFQRAVRDERWKLIRYDVEGVVTVQLFDLSTDPDEVTNLADDAKFADERKRLESLLDTARREADDPRVTAKSPPR